MRLLILATAIISFTAGLGFYKHFLGGDEKSSSSEWIPFSRDGPILCNDFAAHAVRMQCHHETTSESLELLKGITGAVKFVDHTDPRYEGFKLLGYKLHFDYDPEMIKSLGLSDRGAVFSLPDFRLFDADGFELVNSVRNDNSSDKRKAIFIGEVFGYNHQSLTDVAIPMEVVSRVRKVTVTIEQKLSFADMSQ